MKKTIYECDCCKRQLSESVIVHLKQRRLVYSFGNGYSPKKGKFDICYDCLDEIGKKMKNA